MDSRWFKDTGIEVATSDGRRVKVINFEYAEEPQILERWAQRLRNHYIDESELNSAYQSTGLSRYDYLKSIVLPSKPHTRSGDFSEILIADYLEFILNYFVPRTRYENRLNKDNSSFGIDVVGFKKHADKDNVNDELITCEVKGLLASRNGSVLKEALDGSIKDYSDPTRLPEALNAIRQRLKTKRKLDLVNLVERFQDVTARPYKNISGAALVCSNQFWDDNVITRIDSTHPNSNVFIIVIRGEDLMDLTDKLYELANASA